MNASKISLHPILRPDLNQILTIYLTICSTAERVIGFDISSSKIVVIGPGMSVLLQLPSSILH